MDGPSHEITRTSYSNDPNSPSPPGSGKSTACELLKAVLDRRGGAALIGRDLSKSAHSAYHRLLRLDDCTAGVRVRPDVLRWRAQVEEYVRGRRLDAVVETPVADPEQARAYRRSGYCVEVLVIAEAAARTELSTLDRYLGQHPDYRQLLRRSRVRRRPGSVLTTGAGRPGRRRMSVSAAATC